MYHLKKTVTDEMTSDARLVSLDTREPVWSRFFMVAPLVVIGTREEDGYNLAPKHMAMPIGWENYFGFVCTPRHATYANIRKHGYFTVSFPKPSQVVVASMTAEPRCSEEREKPALRQLPTFRARSMDGVLLEDAYLFLECKMEKIIDGFGKNSLITGYIVAAHVDEDYLRRSDVDEAKLIKQAPLLTYLSPGRYASVHDTNAFPFPSGFER